MSDGPAKVTFTLDQQGDARTLHVDGYLDNTTCSELDDFMRHYTEQHGSAFTMDVDCSKLEFLTSRAVSLIIFYYDQFKEAGGRFRLINLSRDVGTVMERLGFGDLDLIRWDSPSAE